MLTTQIKKITSYHFQQASAPAPLLDNLRLLQAELGDPLSDGFAEVESHLQQARHERPLVAGLLVADLRDEKLTDFAARFFGMNDLPKLLANEGRFSQTRTFATGNVQFEAGTFDCVSSAAYNLAPSVGIFLLRKNEEQIATLLDYIASDLFQAALNFVCSPDDLSDTSALRLASLNKQVEVLSFQQMEAFKNAEGFFQENRLFQKAEWLASWSSLRAVKNFGTCLSHLLRSKQANASLRMKETAVEIDQLKTKSQTMQRNDLGNKLTKALREQLFFVENQAPKPAASLQFDAGEATLEQSKIGNKLVHRLPPRLLADWQAKTSEENQALARTLVEMHDRFCQTLNTGLLGFNEQVKLGGLMPEELAAEPSMQTLKPEDFQFEMAAPNFQQLFYSGFRPFFIISMLISVGGTVAGLFYPSGNGGAFSLRNLIAFISDSPFAKVLGLALVAMLLYTLIKNALESKKEQAFVLEKETTKLRHRLQTETARSAADQWRQVLTKYKTTLERLAQQTLNDYESLQEKLNEQAARANKERLRLLEKQSALFQEEVKKYDETSKALKLHEDSFHEYQGLLLQRIRA